MIKPALLRILKALGLLPRLDEEKARRLARHADATVRARLAAREDLRPELLHRLAEDPSAAVRRKVAANRGTPREADLLLARDDDGGVRESLAEKIARLAPGLTAHERDHIQCMTYQTLEILARDQLPRVRRILADILKDMPDAPREIVNRLACDAEFEVAEPVLRNSPVLTDEEILEIIRNFPASWRLKAVSQRQNLGACVSDEIAASDDVDAIAALLANPSAQIREETLDRIIDRAPGIEAWHDPLARRPRLSPAAVRRIARFVGRTLVETLQARGDLDPATGEALKKELNRRLEGPGRGGPRAGAGGDATQEKVRRLKAEGRLTEEAVAAALAAGERAFVATALAALAGQPQALVEKIVESRSPRGLTALCWKAGLSMRFATQLQVRFAHIAPFAALNPADGGKYPLKPAEMDWQIEFFASMIPAPAERAAARRSSG